MEPPPPLQPGISRLYSLEFYDAVRRHLRPGGIASQWLPEYQMDERGADLVVATFVKSFPNAFLFVGVGRELILVGSDEPFAFRGLAARLSQEPAVRAALAKSGLDSPGAILATILRTDDSLRQTWPRGPFVRDGFASLDALQISSPVQKISGVAHGSPGSRISRTTCPPSSGLSAARRPPRWKTWNAGSRVRPICPGRSRPNTSARGTDGAAPKSRPSPAPGASSLPRSPTGPSRARRGRPPRGAAARRA